MALKARGRGCEELRLLQNLAFCPPWECNSSHMPETPGKDTDMRGEEAIVIGVTPTHAHAHIPSVCPLAFFLFFPFLACSVFTDRDHKSMWTS